MEASPSGAGGGATIYRFPSARVRVDGRDAYFALRIDNFDHIELAYGRVEALHAQALLQAALSDLIGDSGEVSAHPGGVITLRVWDRELIGDGPAESACARLLQSVVATLVATPIAVSDALVHVAVSGAWTAKRGRQAGSDAHAQAAAGLALIPSPGDPPARSEEWARRYRCDMDAAAQVLGALGDGSFALARQPIVGVANALRPVLYHETLLRLACAGRWTAPHLYVPALERLGLVRLLDRDVVARALTELEADRSITLGANISAQSACLDGWWLQLCDVLRRRRDLATRLIIEITESWPFRSVAEAATFSARMRELGCRIAIKNFGANRASFRQLRALRPDIAKVDPFFLTQAETGPRDASVLRHVIGLAHAIAPVVVASGVETPSLSRLARASGAAWQQGCLLGAPAIEPLRAEAGARATPPRARRPSGAAGV